MVKKRSKKKIGKSRTGRVGRNILLTFLFMILSVAVFRTGVSLYTDQRSRAATEGMVEIFVDPQQVIREFSPSPLGITMNYLMDDDGNRANLGISLTRSTRDALAATGVKYLRYPGGEKADSYFWSEYPWDRARPKLGRYGAAPQWPAGDATLVWPNYDQADPNDDYRKFKINPLDFDEFMSMARSLGAEPVIVVPYDAMYKAAYPGGNQPTRAELLKNAEEWVRYANKVKNYAIKYWEIGNESYLPTYNNDPISAATYANDLREFSARMKAVDSSIKIGANGGDSAWWQTVLQQAQNSIDFLSVHDYTWQWGSYDFYVQTDPSLLSAAYVADQAINSFASTAKKNSLSILMTEMNSIDYSDNGWDSTGNLGHGLVLFDMIGRHFAMPRVKATILYTTRWITNTNDTVPKIYDAFDKYNNLNIGGRVLSVWKQFLGKKLVNSTWVPSMHNFATFNPSTNKLYFMIINKYATTRSATVRLQNYRSKSLAEVWKLQGNSPEDITPSLSKTGIVSVTNNAAAITLDPYSITILSFSAL